MLDAHHKGDAVGALNAGASAPESTTTDASTTGTAGIPSRIAYPSDSTTSTTRIPGPIADPGDSTTGATRIPGAVADRDIHRLDKPFQRAPQP
jgi:hypothetical protein